MLSSCWHAMSQIPAQADLSCRHDMVALSAHAEGSAQVAASCKEHGAKNVEIYSVDLTSSKDIDQLCKDLLSKHKVDVLVSSWVVCSAVDLTRSDPDSAVLAQVNNAGMATFNEAPYESECKLVWLHAV